MRSVCSYAQVDGSLEQARNKAVAQARAGNTTEGLATLQQLLQQEPESVPLLADTITVAGWAGDDNLAVTLFDAHPSVQKTPYAVKAAAYSFRNLGQLDRSLQLYQQGMEIAPGDWEMPLGAAMVLTDQQQFDRALKILSGIAVNSDNEDDLLFGKAYICTRKGDYACALMVYQNNKVWTNNSNLKTCEPAQSLSNIGAPILARDTCGAHASPAWLQILADAAAEQIHWGVAELPTRAEQERHSLVALAAIDFVLQHVQPGDSLWKRVQADRLVVLANLWRYAEVTRAYEQLRGQMQIPEYALLRVAEAYLAQHHQHHARDLYNGIAKKDPRASEAWSGLGYAQSETGQFRDAFRSADYGAAHAPSLLYSQDQRSTWSNPAGLQLRSESAELRGEAGMYASAQDRLKGLLAVSPGNVDLHHGLADTYAHRGWPLRALQETNIADRFDQPINLPSLETAEILEQVERRDNVDAMMPLILIREGHSPSVQRFISDMHANRGWQLDVDGDQEWSRGQFLGNYEQHAGGRLSTPLFANRWRGFVDGMEQTGDFDQGSVQRTRIGAGLLYEYDRRYLWVAGNRDGGDTGTRGSLTMGGGIRLNDTWSVDGLFDSNAFDAIQLIAAFDNVRARRGEATVHWRRSELLQASVTYGIAKYTDDNLRTDVSGNVVKRIYTAPRVTVDLIPEASFEKNSPKQTRIYFNPATDFSAGAGGAVSWLTWRRYEKSWVQKFTGSAAPFWQEDFGVGRALGADYSSEVKLSRRFGFQVGVSYRTQPYDGVNGGYTAFTYGVTWGK